MKAKKFLFIVIKLVEEIVFLAIALAILLTLPNYVAKFLSFALTQVLFVVGFLLLVGWHEFFFKQDLYEKIGLKLGVPPKAKAETAKEQEPSEEEAPAEETPAADE